MPFGNDGEEDKEGDEEAVDEDDGGGDQPIVALPLSTT